jgi:hypothetical protein
MPAKRAVRGARAPIANEHRRLNARGASAASALGVEETRGRQSLAARLSVTSSEPPFMLPRFRRRRCATRHKLGIQRHTGYKGHEIATLERDA